MIANSDIESKASDDGENENVGFCVNFCGIGFIENKELKICETCHSSCKHCSKPNN